MADNRPHRQSYMVKTCTKFHDKQLNSAIASTMGQH